MKSIVNITYNSQLFYENFDTIIIKMIIVTSVFKTIVNNLF